MIAPNKSAPVVFLAEDSEDDAFFFQRAFRKAAQGCTLLRATDGKMAIERLKESRSAGAAPILIFLDLKMPVLSGFEVLEWLKFSDFDHVPRVIVLSGSNDEDDRARALKLGAVEYLVKPITEEILRARIAEELELLRQTQRQRESA
jgi:CheY-like chemotaxis protein